MRSCYCHSLGNETFESHAANVNFCPALFLSCYKVGERNTDMKITKYPQQRKPLRDTHILNKHFFLGLTKNRGLKLPYGSYPDFNANEVLNVSPKRSFKIVKQKNFPVGYNLLTHRAICLPYY